MSFDKTIQMCIFDGNPNGRIMCELSNWNGRIYKISRKELNEFSKRSDAEHTGIYFLFGKDELNNDTIYIGEAEKILTRLKQHINDIDYWNDCVAVISKDDLLNKAHIKYLENKFYNLAATSNRTIIINKTVPTCSSISEYDEAMLNEFISNTKLLVNTLGYKVFDTFDINENSKNQTQYFYTKSPRGANAKGILTPDGFTVLKGSIIANSVVNSFIKTQPNLNKLRTKLIENNIIDKNYTFTKDYNFTSPSTAACIVLGRSANGRIEWKTSDGETIKAIEESKNI